MALTASGFYTSPAGEWSAAVSSFNVYFDAETVVGWPMAGGTLSDPNVVDAQAVRQKKFTGVTVNTTETTVAHGLTDSSGNPVVPKWILQTAGPGVMASTQEPDAQNLYLIATVAGSYDFVVAY
jgi:hypothetical protein